MDKFRRKGQWHLIALYHVMRLSDFGREGIERSGSYRFADHLYRNEPSGRGRFGRWLDRRLMDLPSARAMRQRYFKVIETLGAELARRDGEIRVLTLPCGIPRDLSELAARDPAAVKRICYTGMDLDPEVIDAAREHLQNITLGSVDFLQGNALIGSSYPRERFDFIASTGLGEFLNDEDLARFYWHVFDALEPGGLFFTSATAYERKSDFLMKAFEMEAHYRDRERIEEIFRALPWSELDFELDPSGLQTFVRARK